jgi:hypothetical protein
MLIQCTMREGITEADIEGYRYTFRPDNQGNSICSVTKEGHIKELLNMGPHCYAEFKPAIPIEQMSADEILAQPEGLYEPEKATVRQQRADAAKEKAMKAAEPAQKPEEAKKAEPETKEEKPTVTQSAAAGMAESRIEAIIKSFKTLNKERFGNWLEANHDTIATMPEDVKAELAKKVKKNWPKLDPEIPGLDLEKYAKRTDATHKGHSNNK